MRKDKAQRLVNGHREVSKTSLDMPHITLHAKKRLKERSYKQLNDVKMHPERYGGVVKRCKYNPNKKVVVTFIPRSYNRPTIKCTRVVTYNPITVKCEDASNDTLSTPPSFLCHICDKKFSNKYDIAQHVDTVHALFEL